MANEKMWATVLNRMLHKPWEVVLLVLAIGGIAYLVLPRATEFIRAKNQKHPAATYQTNNVGTQNQNGSHNQLRSDHNQNVQNNTGSVTQTNKDQ